MHLVQASSVMHIIRAPALWISHVHLSKRRVSKPALISSNLLLLLLQAWWRCVLELVQANRKPYAGRFLFTWWTTLC
jgi:hypothetical protein